MALTAKGLGRQAGARARALALSAGETLRAVDDRLRRAPPLWGRNCVAHDLPDLFLVPGMERRDAQRAVYAEVIRSLEARGFETALELAPDGRAVLHVAWSTADSGADAARQAALLRARLVAPADVPRFARGEAAPRKKAPAGRGPPAGGGLSAEGGPPAGENPPAGGGPPAKGPPVGKGPPAGKASPFSLRFRP